MQHDTIFKRIRNEINGLITKKIKQVEIRMAFLDVAVQENN